MKGLGDLTRPFELPSLEWYLPTTDGRCQIYVKEIGEGAPVIALHGGFGHDHGYFVRAFEGLDPIYCFIFYDQRGSLRSPAPLEAITFDNHIEDLELLRQELGLQGVTLVGHSMGSLLAMAYQARYPDRVENLVLVGPVAPRAPDSDEERKMHSEQASARVKWALRQEIEDEIRKEGLDEEPLSARDRSLGDRLRFGAMQLAHIERWREIRGAGAFYNETAGQAAERSIPAGFDFVPTLARQRGAVTVITGTHEYQDMGCRMISRTLEDLPNVRLEILPRAGHCSWVDQPQLFRQALGKALRRSTESRSS